MNTSTPAAPRDRGGFEVALICALSLEADYATFIFDKFWDEDGKEYGKAYGDHNQYTTGVIGRYNVVLAHMPGPGKVDAAHVAANLRISFPSVKLVIVLGICGAAPRDHEGYDIILGDVIISDTLIQYDYGRQYPDKFVPKRDNKDFSGGAAPEVRGILAKLQTRRSSQKIQDDMTKYLTTLCEKQLRSRYPGVEADQLFEAFYSHEEPPSMSGDVLEPPNNMRISSSTNALKMTCAESGCDSKYLVERLRLSNNGPSEEPTPMIHFGLIGSADTVMRSALRRDQLVKSHGIIAFEQEGAGVWQWCSSVVIKGVCDYADSHKNKLWQNRAAAAAACCAKAALQQWTPEDRPECRNHFSVSEPLLRHIPFSDLPDFIGREDKLHEVQAKLFSPDGYRKVAVYGLGGVGKSRLALEVARCAQSMESLHSIMWVQGSTVETFEKDFLNIGEKLQIPGIRDSGADVKGLVKQRLSLESTGKWLMVVDNADDEAVWKTLRRRQGDDATVASYIPRSPFGSVLFTTRSRQIGVHLAQSNVIEIGQMTIVEAASTLRNLLARPDILDEDCEATSTLLQELSYLPLAIVQAAAYINMNDVTISEYASLLRDVTEESLVSLLSKDFVDESRYDDAENTVASTWLVSLKQIQRNHPQAIDCLSYMSCLHEKDIPQTLVPHFSIVENMLEVRAILTGYSFIRAQTKDHLHAPLYDMHRLVRLATRNWLRKEHVLLGWTKKAMERVAQHFPAGDYEDKSRWTLYMPHALNLLNSGDSQDFPERYTLMHKVGLCLWTDGLYIQPNQYLHAAAQWQATTFGDESEVALNTYSDLGHFLQEHGEETEAEQWITRALRGQEKLLGSEHLDTLKSLYALSAIHYRQRRLKEAETLCKEVIEKRRMVLGVEHTVVLDSMNLLALVYKGQGQFIEAETLLQEILKMRRRILGIENPRTLVAMENLGCVYRSQGRLMEAETLIQEALRINQCISGVDHPRTLITMAHLADIHSLQDRFMEAEALYQEVLKIRQRTIGVDHPQTLRTMANLARSLKDLGHIRNACELMKQCLELSNVRLGVDHPDTQRRNRVLQKWLLRIPDDSSS